MGAMVTFLQSNTKLSQENGEVAAFYLFNLCLYRTLRLESWRMAKNTHGLGRQVTEKRKLFRLQQLHNL